ncbi:MAG: SDR family oxidoreductase [Myxococcales bacterium]|nr:SDR family oxidoreductase [Myxococcales bacterium]
MSTYLVTGGAGFIGSNIVASLVARGHSVRVLDDLSSGNLQNLAPVMDRIAFHHGDIRDARLVMSVVDGCDYVFHEAAIPSVVKSVEDPSTTHDVNINGTFNVFDAARRAGVKRVVFAGSSAVYGNSEVLPKVETMATAPLSPYALHKATGEQYGHLFTELYGLEIVTLRYFNVFGPRQDPKSDYAAVIPRFITMMLAGKSVTIFGDGQQTRDFCYIDNVVEANLLACTAPGAAGRSFNIACGLRISLLDLVERLNGILGTSLAPNHAPPRAGDIAHSVADIRAAESGLGFVPAIDVTEGLARTVAWFRGGQGG